MERKRENVRSEKRGKRKLPALQPDPFLSLEMKRCKDRSDEECVPEGEEEERERERGIGRAGHLREMDLGAPRGHILFPFEAPDKSNAAECIIR